MQTQQSLFHSQKFHTKLARKQSSQTVEAWPAPSIIVIQTQMSANVVMSREAVLRWEKKTRVESSENRKHRGVERIVRRRGDFQRGVEAGVRRQLMMELVSNMTSLSQWDSFWYMGRVNFAKSSAPSSSRLISSMFLALHSRGQLQIAQYPSSRTHVEMQCACTFYPYVVK